MLDQDLLDILACPLCKSEIDQQEDQLHCTNAECGCIYRIEDEIPVMLIEEAERPCPNCEQQRNWKEDKEVLVCPDCDTSISYQRA